MPTDPPRLYWRKPEGPRKPRPPEDSPKHKAYVARICGELKKSTAASNGLESCPRCKAEVGVHLVKEARSRWNDSRRMFFATCEDCKLTGPLAIGMQGARDAWNDDGWRKTAGVGGASA